MKFHHVAIVVNDIESNTEWYCCVYKAKRIGPLFVDESQEVKVQFLESAGMKIELLEPLSGNSPVSSFLKECGSGRLYHIAYEVEDLNKVIKDVKDQGGIVVSRTDNGWGGMEVMFAVFLKNNEKQLIEYVVT